MLEVVHVSNDLKHDAHLIKKLHATTMNVLKQHNMLVHKISVTKPLLNTKTRHHLIT